MLDLGSILSKAIQEASKIDGNGGSSGNGNELDLNINDLQSSHPVTMPADDLVTLVTGAEDVTTAMRANRSLVTAHGYKNNDENHIVREDVTTVTKVTTKNEVGRRKSSAVTTRRAELSNSAAAFEPQQDTSRCHVCAHRAEPDRPLLPICAAQPGRHHWLHGDCWPAHVRCIAERVAAITAGVAPT